MTTNEAGLGEMFVVGAEFENRAGRYKVVEDRGTDILVKYLSGEREGELVLLEKVGQVKVFRNMNKEQARLFNVDRGSFYKVLGYLAGCGRLYANVTDKQKAGFVAQYRALTGVEVSVPGEYVYVRAEDSATWGAELSISFKAPEGNFDGMDFGCEVQVRVVDDNRLAISRNEFWWRMIGMGFRLGGVQDVEGIRERIPSMHRGEFDQGVGELVRDQEAA